MPKHVADAFNAVPRDFRTERFQVIGYCPASLGDNLNGALDEILQLPARLKIGEGLSLSNLIDPVQRF